MEFKKRKTVTGFTRLGKVLEKQAKNYQLDELFWQKRALRLWHQAAREFVAEAGTLTKAINFKQGTLVVACLTHEVAYQIRILTQRILTLLNELLGKFMVRTIALEV